VVSLQAVADATSSVRSTTKVAASECCGAATVATISSAAATIARLAPRDGSFSVRGRGLATDPFVILHLPAGSARHAILTRET
jgi:hypothetical protein